jgi:hypothetical protein
MDGFFLPEVIRERRTYGGHRIKQGSDMRREVVSKKATYASRLLSPCAHLG